MGKRRASEQNLGIAYFQESREGEEPSKGADRRKTSKMWCPKAQRRKCFKERCSALLNATDGLRDMMKTKKEKTKKTKKTTTGFGLIQVIVDIDRNSNRVKIRGKPGFYRVANNMGFGFSQLTIIVTLNYDSESTTCFMKTVSSMRGVDCKQLYEVSRGSAIIPILQIKKLNLKH